MIIVDHVTDNQRRQPSPASSIDRTLSKMKKSELSGIQSEVEVDGRFDRLDIANDP
jgi:hypothetical protein